MIEMSVVKESVLSCEGNTELPSHQPSELSGNDTNVLHSPGKTTDTHLCKEDGKETENVTSHEHTESIADNSVASESGLLEAEFCTQTQNGTPQSKQQTQRLNKRRSTMSAGFKFPGFGKRRRRANSESSSVLPTNFLLGGNIFDPLNLNSLLDEEVNRALNAETPKSSPLPAKNRDPVEILIPRDITDPLNLNCPSTRDRSLLMSPLKSGGRRRHRNKHHGAGGRALSESMVSQPEFSETNGGSAAKVDEAASLSTSHESGTVVDRLDSETLKDDQTLLSCTPEAQSTNKPNSTTNGDEVKDKRGSTPPTNDASTAPPSTNPTNPSSNRQRKRKRPSGRMDTDCSYGARSTGSNSQSFQAAGTGRASGVADRPNPNHCRSQYNNNHNQQQKKKFQYGNYNKYYGYRNPGLSDDHRIRVFKPEWFRGKAVLDLGCNTGHVTLSIAKNWCPSRILGLDIDGSLIHAARQNIRHYLSVVQTQQSRRSGENGAREEEKDLVGEKSKREESNEEKRAPTDEHVAMEVAEQSKERKGSDAENKSTDDDGKGESGKMEYGECVGLPDVKNSFPVSLRISRGPIAAPPLPEMRANSLPPGDFPANITFVKGNYVLESDSLLLTQKEEYDVILCLSMTKWVHLNWGDAGLKRLFHRIYRHLRPGGLFILEPQPWNSYSKRKKLTEVIGKNYHGIRLRPDQFSSFLTTEVGFNSYELIGTPQNLSRGFQRPIYLFHKGPSPQK
ncbi:7SK snRNA methylphosphate capping enzyme [Triplophysa tibetana]|uniref:RNA methyltransferase n=1 Tax=Triplophysa tibetana TaxID=1572043 RepID=A0A5A9P311_9TELE|nr:7SK snRNA methylphosphate capping enzyme [Triplophysa tibetana]